MEKERNYKEIIRAIKFTIVSISAGIIQVGSFALIHYVFHLEEWFANALSMLLSIIWNFTINRKITFKSLNNIKISMLLVALFYVVFLPLSSLFTDVTTDKGWNPMLVEAIVLLSNFVLEFLYTRFVVYRNSCDTIKEKENVE